MYNVIIGTVELADNSKDVTISLDGENGNITLGGGGHDGDILMKNSADKTTVGINAQAGAIHLGGTGQDGDLLLRAANNEKTIQLDGATGQAVLGGGGQDGDLIVKNSSGSTTVYIDGQSGSIKIRDWKISVPDYVFDSNYKLRTPDSLRKFINANGHLPEVPSADEVARDGLDLNCFCMTLLRKIEELTLYSLDQDMVIEKLKRRVDDVSVRNGDHCNMPEE
ncbi:MAG: hypothetical protein GY862_22115 [Gammaproteobacteria bacterium]|nr:hypothetical protein [Gammaproteobacteria bacterium]